MRIILLAAAMALAASAYAQQPVLDAKATAGGPVGDVLREAVATPGISKDELRKLMGVMMARQYPPADRDLMSELAAGADVEVMVDGPAMRVEALKGDVLAIAKLMSAPPNLNTLWMQAGEPTLQLVEMSRWGDPAKTRVTGFMSNKLYVAWSKSTVQNTYSPFVSEFAGINNAVMAIADPAVKTEARLLLKSAVEQVFASCKKDGREPPPHFLYAFAFESVGVPHL